jgi:signal peptidase I
MENRNPNRIKTKSALREWSESIAIAFIVAIFIRTFFIQAFKIPSGSMRSTLLEGDRLLANKLAYGPKIPFTDKRLPGFTQPKRGDIIIFKYPKDPRKDFIKRLIAVGGEVVEIKYGDVYINGQLIENPLIKNVYYYNREESDFGKSNQRIKVPDDSYFVLGDNSASSSDSRYWGFVPKSDVIGKAELIYWPLTRIRFVK